MKDFEFGQIVISKAGRDHGNIYIIFEFKGEYVYLVDGDSRRIENPKKKKVKHIQPTNIVIESLKEKNYSEMKISNADIRKQLQEYSYLSSNKI